MFEAAVPLAPADGADYLADGATDDVDTTSSPAVGSIATRHNFAEVWLWVDGAVTAGYTSTPRRGFAVVRPASPFPRHPLFRACSPK